MNENGARDHDPEDEALRALYRQLPADEPGAHIDAALRAAAHDAAREARQRRRLWPVLRWSVPLAAAAAALLVMVIDDGANSPSERKTPSDEQAAIYALFAEAEVQVAEAPATAPTVAAPKALREPASSARAPRATATPQKVERATPRMAVGDRLPPAARLRGIAAGPWGFGLAPSLPPELACERIPADLVAGCHAEASDDGRRLVLTIQATDGNTFASRLSAACEEAGWERTDASDPDAPERWTQPVGPGQFLVERAGDTFTLRAVADPSR